MSFAKKCFSIVFYPSPKPLPHTRGFWYALGLVSVAVVVFSAFFILFFTGRYNAYLVNAEDMGIMDQAIWNTVHGQVLHQTICNIISDTNCYSPAGIMRFALHFEPMLFPVALLYLLWPDPRTLLVLQTLVVASGAFPAFWLARLRLRNEAAAVGIALLYLLNPALQAALEFDFHAVTFTAALLLFMLYFLYTRRTLLLFVFALLAMMCKEEIALVVICCGLWSILFQHRWRSGLLLTLFASAWALLALVIIPHLFSPTSHSLLVSRYTPLGSTPAQVAQTLLFHPLYILKDYVLEPGRFHYLRALISPSGYFPLLTPWLIPLMVPTLAINLLSSDLQMHTGYAFFQYNAELVPILIFAMVEAMVLLLWIARKLLERLPAPELLVPRIGATTFPRISVSRRTIYALLFISLVAYVSAATLHGDYTQNTTLFGKSFSWPTPTAHNELAQHFIAMIPPDAPVSAQSQLVPHLSHRETIYLFPYGDGSKTPAYADYIFLDETSDVYPFYSAHDYHSEVDKVIQSKLYCTIAQQDSFLLLRRCSIT